MARQLRIAALRAERAELIRVWQSNHISDDVMHRLKVRWAALPTSRLSEFAARYPEGALPRTLTFDHADSALDVTIFRVQP